MRIWWVKFFPNRKINHYAFLILHAIIHLMRIWAFIGRKSHNSNAHGDFLLKFNSSAEGTKRDVKYLKLKTKSDASKTQSDVEPYFLNENSQTNEYGF